MVGERRHGPRLVQLGPRLQAFPEELIRQRRGHAGQPEYLIRWCLVAIDDGGSASESEPENILMWMSGEDAYANCPGLLGGREQEARRGEEPPAGAALDEAELSDMKRDVENLVRRARAQMTKSGDFSLGVAHTVHVLSAYAAIGPLVGVFKEAGALRLLMELLGNKDTHTRRGAGKMLRALASHDAGSRAYVLLSLSQQDGIEQHMDFENRFTLLELFNETASCGEHGVSLQGLQLPQIPGKLLFSLVKRYLCVTSLMEELNTPGAESTSAGPDTSPASSSGSARRAERLRTQREFDFSVAMAGLISELVRVMGWDRNRRPPPGSAPGTGGGGACGAELGPVLKSIFQPRSSTSPAVLTGTFAPAAAAPPKKKKTGKGYKTLADFPGGAAYGEYVQQRLRSGMKVRMLQDYEEVSAGDLGEVRYSNDGSPPVQVYWSSLSRTYWVHWHMVEIQGDEEEEVQQEAQQEASSLTETLRLPAVSRSVCPPGALYSGAPQPGAPQPGAPQPLSRAAWWELLFFIRKLEAPQQQEVTGLLRALGPQEAELDDRALIGLSVPGGVASELLRYLERKLPPASLAELLSSRSFSGLHPQGAGPPGERLRPPPVPETGSPDHELPPEDHSMYPEDLEDRMKVFDDPRVQAQKTLLEKLGGVVDLLKTGSSSDPGQQLAAILVATRLLEEAGATERTTPERGDSAQSILDRVLLLLLELLASASGPVAVAALGLARRLLLAFPWRLSFATGGGVRAVLGCMQRFPSNAPVQQLALATLQVVSGASQQDPVPLSESGSPLMLEIFSSIGSAAPGSGGPLGAVPAAMDLLLQTGCLPALRSGLLLVLALVSNHSALAEQLVAVDLTSVLRRCLTLPTAEATLAVIALHHLTSGGGGPLDLKELELRMLVESLKDPRVSREVVHTLEALLCDAAPLEEGRRQVTGSRDTFQELVRLLEQHRADRAVQLSLLRILNKFLDQYQEDLLPWHESIEPCLSSMTAFLPDREVVQLLVRFLFRLASLNQDLAVVLCRLGSREVLLEALERHGAGLALAPELRDLVGDCDKYASLYQKMTAGVLAGCIQMVLGQVEEHRRSHRPINVPFFDVFLRNLCQGSSVELKEDACWEKVEVSSNQHRAAKLTDKNPKSYWESNGCTGSHSITVTMRRGVVIRRMSLLVAADDSSYMPARVLVLGGDDPTSINTELSTVNVTPSASRVVLVENLTRFWSIIQIRIKRCQQGGIDTRVHGFEVLGPKPTFWPVFKEQLCCRTSLFYSTKAHTWCREVKEDRTQLLQLFNKLNSALRHEQMFADRFLPDAEASETLGRTCWEALITPIVLSITQSESLAPSPLSWLLTEYLGNGVSARRCESRAAIFNSRVRRLTHLLVHVDLSRLEGEELRPPLKSKGLNRSKETKNGKEEKNKEAASSSSSSSSSSAKPKAKGSGSIAGIALCWQGVVQRQVKLFLEASGGEPGFVERYRALYLRLRGAMEELFGRHAAFQLALRRGFSGALLQLSILRAMQVSERFSQYIDSSIQASGAAPSGAQTLERLQQFLEPLLFLSGLELANTFEHFYRYYLGDRLLAGANVWLESAVVEQIGGCFPSRFPQQMLENLSESARLKQEFHLHRLQQLDRRLQRQEEEEEAAAPVAEEPVAEEEAAEEEAAEDEAEEWAESEEAQVQVVVLSPRCWAVSSLCFLEEPSSHFPEQLCCYLSQFTQFYSHTAPPRPRRLQWTWLGDAELQFGCWRLQVSTVQMFILLQLNTHTEVSVASLLQSSGLSADILLQALRPLIAEGGPLSCSPEEEEPCGGVLQVNQQVASLSRGAAACVRLLPRQTYLKVEADAAGALERKRSLLSCLVVHIMKREKEMHIDNLIFKVLASCRTREACGGRFGCSSGDVLSCIMHVVSRGCVRRREDNPHILEFLPEDPPTPQKGHAHFSFSEDGKDAAEDHISGRSSSRRLEDGVLDALLFPMGQTMTQEEVRQLMQRTVQQVSGTLSLDPDRAERLLVHCRWNVDLLVRRYSDEPEALAVAAGLESRNPQPSPASTCPVCLGPRPPLTEPAPSLSCMHYCCRACWQEYLTARIEQNLVATCHCPITDCRAQPTSGFFLRVLTDEDTVAKYRSALLRGFVDSCSNLTWCSNPQGCGRVLRSESPGGAATCTACSWASCCSCSFPEAHVPASCSHMSQWLDDGGFYEGMTTEAQSKHLAKLIAKSCPSCQAPIERNEGCLHMTCAKCNHGFCWRCLKPWKPTHKDYYNCSAMVSKAARQEKKFQDYNERCSFHHQAKDFAVQLEARVSSINAALQMKPLTFVIDACRVLAQARKVLAYSCVYSYYNQETEKMEVMEQQTEALDLHTNALQILLEETLLQSSDLASCVRLLKPEQLNTGLERTRRIQERLLAILQHSTQDFRVGYQSKNSQEPGSTQTSSLATNTEANKGSEASSDSDDDNYGGEDDEEDDEEYVPEWHEDYDEDAGDEDDFFSDDDESENLERDFSPFD